MRIFHLTLIFFLLAGCAHQEKITFAPNLAHGNEQTRRMIDDRPEMGIYTDQSGNRKHITPNDAIWKWCASKFAGEGLKNLINWSSEEPSDWGCHDADNTFNNDGKPGRIRIRNRHICGGETDRTRSFDSLWSSAVFELLNIESSKEFDRLYDLAISCQLTKPEWVQFNLKVEYSAKIKQADFYKSTWIPWVKSVGAKSDSSYWPEKVLPFEQWARRWSDDPTEYWHRYYDEKMRPYLDNIGCSK